MSWDIPTVGHIGAEWAPALTVRRDPRGVIESHRQALDEAAEAEAAHTEIATAPAWWRWTQRPRAAELADQRGFALTRARALRQQFGAHGVGSTPGMWGVFSSAQDFYLENTLTSLLGWLNSDHAEATVDQLLKHLPDLRLAAHNGDRSAETRVEGLVRDLAGAVEDRYRRLALLEHLPGHARPLPESVRDIERGLPPVTLYVTDNVEEMRRWKRLDPEARRQITLHDIVVPGNLTSLGLGTAVLVHLCRFADAVDAEIVGQMYPGPGFDDYETRIPRLARWYARHGFRAGDAPPHTWQGGEEITREPHAESHYPA
ncbi:hypothetical protein NUM3379_34900 [Kineococcus sp. NUM-3379]